MGIMPNMQREELSALYIEQQAALLRFLIARLRNPTLAEDVLQDLYIKLAECRLPEQIENQTGFLFRMASNLAFDHIRKIKRSKVRDHAWSDLNHEKIGNDYKIDTPHVDDALIAKERLAALMLCLESLSPKAREAFTRHKIRGQSYRQVADEMDITIGTVGKHMVKALKHIMSGNLEDSENERN
ncbi:MAG: RNA polymerase subunit sigma-24 [Robiginitomaculum sp.]|nr:MAG: RNA polymerase subunit sigma-24 [Robiginitomaculum sp.]